MKIRLKRFLNKYKNRIFSFIAVFAFVPLFAFNAFAVENFYTTILPNDVSPLNLYFSDNSTFSDSDGWQGDIANMYRFSNPAKTVSSMNFVLGATNAFNVITESYDYYVTLFYTSLGASNTFNPNTFRASVLEGSAGSIVTLSNIIIDPVFMRESGNVYSGHVCVGKLPNTWDGSFRGVYVGGSSGSVGSYLSVYISVTQVPKDTSAEEVLAIVSAINNQTTTLGGKIDDTNDFINNGNGSTSGIVSGNNSAVDNLDEVISEYHATEQQFFDDFNSNQQAISSDIVGWSWGGLVNCANWVGDTMTDYYNNMGDFRQYIIYPLMLGIALFFLGRGGSIIGHLFRKPTHSTVNIESTSFKRGNTRYTTTTTSKKGGVFRR